MTVANEVQVTLAEIARFAGVGRAAVSNWRRRHADFPKPAGGTDTSPLFALTEVSDWLELNGRAAGVTPNDFLWPRFEMLADRDLSGRVLAEFGLAITQGSAGSRDRSEGALPERAGALLNDLVALLPGGKAAEVFAALFDRWGDANVRQVSLTSPELASLMVRMALATSPPAIENPIILDPACGAGEILIQALRKTGSQAIHGVDIDACLAALCRTRLRLESLDVLPRKGASAPVDQISVGDSLLDNPLQRIGADFVLCVPPYNDRDWGQEELATDPRWIYGIPPRSEPELAWVEHCLACLKPGGAGVLILPPAVASRRAGRRIRSALIRSGAIRGVISLPAGASQPFAVPLHMWLLQRPSGDLPNTIEHRVLFVDAADSAVGGATSKPAIDWAQLQTLILSAIESLRHPESRAPTKCAFVPAVQLLDDIVDLTPGRHVRSGDEVDLLFLIGRLRDRLQEFNERFNTVTSASVTPGKHTLGLSTVSDLERADALRVQAGQVVDNTAPSADAAGIGAVPVLTIPDLLQFGEAASWLDRQTAAAANGALVRAMAGDVVVVGTERAYRAWVHAGPPVVVGPQIFVLTPDPNLLDAWFLAGCLRAPSNARQAGTHASSSSRIDVRRLQVLQISHAQQLRYGQVYREVAELEKSLAELSRAGSDLIRHMSDHLASGDSVVA